LVVFELMQAMKWSWSDLAETPPYVRQYCWDLLVIKRAEAARRANERRRSS
jgi:hypothetical protein